MSFGCSIGDFIAVALLIKEIVTSLQGCSSAEHRQLTDELQLLEQALHEIEFLEGPHGQEAVVEAIKVAALKCQAPLDHFACKLKKYDVLAESDSKKMRKVVQGWARKVQWGLFMKEEVQTLRAYLAVHLSSLNVRMTTVGL